MDRKLLRKIFDHPAVRIMIGVITVLLIALIAVCVTVSDREERPPQLDDQTAQTESFSEMTMSLDAESPEEIIPAQVVSPIPSGEVQITISAAGDVTLAAGDDLEYEGSFTEAFEQHEPEWFLNGVRDVFGTDDLTIVNFEGTLSERGEREEGSTAFRGEPEYVRILTRGSVEACSLANNCAFAYGKDAYEDTKKTLESSGIISFGYDRSQVVDVKGIRVGLVGIAALEQQENSRALLEQEIEAVKEKGARLVIVSFHWGDEWSYDLNERQIELAHAAVDAGAHLVLGHHPHCVQGIGRYGGVHICYSLGSLCTGRNNGQADMDCYIFRQTFTFEDGVLQDRDEYLVIPCSMSSASEYNNYRPQIYEDEEADRVLEKVDSLL